MLRLRGGVNAIGTAVDIGPGKFVRVALLAGTCTMCSSCQDPRAMSALQSEVAGLRATINSQDVAAKALVTRMDNLERDLAWQKIVESAGSTAYLTPGSSGFSTIQTDMGPITASLQNVTAYASGTKATLHFGNLSTGEYSNIGMAIDWGMLDADRAPNNETVRSKEVALIETFKSGSWTQVDVVLEGIPPTDLGFVRIHHLNPKQVWLRKTN